MRYIIISLLFLMTGCDTGSFDKDKRQILAKNYILSKIPAHSSGFYITGFKEDTFQQRSGYSYKHPIAYAMDYRYTDSTGKEITLRDTVLFTPDGHSLITSTSQHQQ